MPSASAKRIAALIPTMVAEKRKQLRENCLPISLGLKTGAYGDAIYLLEELESAEAALIEAESARISTMSLAERVRESFTKQPISDTEHLLVQALLDYPDSHSSKLSEVCGYEGQSWHLHFGLMCARRERGLVPAEPSKTRKGSDGNAANFWSGILANYDDARGWTMKPDVAEAFASLGLRGAR